MFVAKRAKMAYRVQEVSSKRDLKRFIRFPDRLYKHCPQYVPALHSDQVNALTRVSTLSYCTRKMWLVLDGDRVAGRICAMVNPRYNERYGTRRARFGWFDTVNDFEVARLLLETAEAWAKEQGMDEIHDDACAGLDEEGKAAIAQLLAYEESLVPAEYAGDA